jgi:hypothetical protein
MRFEYADNTGRARTGQEIADAIRAALTRDSRCACRRVATTATVTNGHVVVRCQDCAFEAQWRETLRQRDAMRPRPPRR